MGKMKEALQTETETYDAEKVLHYSLLTCIDELAHHLKVLTDLVEEVVLGRVEGRGSL